jgi:hypothetical protein
MILVSETYFFVGQKVLIAKKWKADISKKPTFNKFTFFGTI